VDISLPPALDQFGSVTYGADAAPRRVVAVKEPGQWGRDQATPDCSADLNKVNYIISNGGGKITGPRGCDISKEISGYPQRLLCAKQDKELRGSSFVCRLWTSGKRL
jgi:hypothetical protein